MNHHDPVIIPHLPDVARFLDFVTESLTRAAEQAREVLYTKPETHQPNDQ